MCPLAMLLSFSLSEWCHTSSNFCKQGIWFFWIYLSLLSPIETNVHVISISLRRVLQPPPIIVHMSRYCFKLSHQLPATGQYICPLTVPALLVLLPSLCPLHTHHSSVPWHTWLPRISSLLAPFLPGLRPSLNSAQSLDNDAVTFPCPFFCVEPVPFFICSGFCFSSQLKYYFLEVSLSKSTEWTQKSLLYVPSPESIYFLLICLSLYEVIGFIMIFHTHV